uniref:thymidylate synthase n=1 Tax=viral metagenome TaxID=1070528 RepID=A0A6C0CZ40_9ZZZZ
MNVIVSVNNNNIIGIDNDLLIHSKEDLKNFAMITKYSESDKPNMVIMGYNTWSSIPNRPLKDRVNIVITKNHITEFNNTDDLKAFVTFDNFMEWFDSNKINYNKCFIIGGSSIYNTVFKNYIDYIELIYITKFNHSLDYSREDIQQGSITYFNHNLSKFKLIESTNEYSNVKLLGVDTGMEHTYLTYIHSDMYNYDEYQYLELLKDILNSDKKPTRNGDVYSKFGVRMEFDLRNGFPLLTTKQMGWKTVLRELLWFISGSTDNSELQSKKVHIWDKNADDFEERGLYEKNDLGPVYGFQWRHFGGEYINCKTPPYNGIDQLKYIIDTIKTDPHSRRLILSSWNPVDIPNMALPPCHVLVQFNIEGQYIDAQLYQRSGDMFLGVPFNITSYSFLLHIIGSITGYKPRKFVHVIGDAHIYEQHIEAVKTQINRIPYMFPVLEMKEITDIDNIKETDLNVVGYSSHSRISAEMVV